MILEGDARAKELQLIARCVDVALHGGSAQNLIEASVFDLLVRLVRHRHPKECERLKQSVAGFDGELLIHRQLIHAGHIRDLSWLANSFGDALRHEATKNRLKGG